MIVCIESLIKDEINIYLQRYRNYENITILSVKGSASIKKLIDIDLSIFPNIKELRLSHSYRYNDFVEIKKSILHFKHISILKIYDFVVFRGMFLKDFPNLIEFELSAWDNRDFNFGFVKKLNKLKVLNISFNRYNIKYLPQICILKNLEHLILHLHTTLENISGISDIPSLKKLYINQYTFGFNKQISSLLPLIQLMNSKQLDNTSNVLLPYGRFVYDDIDFFKYASDVSFKTIQNYLNILHREKMLKEMNELIYE